MLFINDVFKAEYGMGRIMSVHIKNGVKVSMFVERRMIGLI